MQVNNPSATFTRPANVTPYAVGNLVANSVTPGSVVPMAFTLGNAFGQGQLRLTRARLYKSGTDITNASFRIHVYEAPPVASNGDGAAWLTTMSRTGSATSTCPRCWPLPTARRAPARVRPARKSSSRHRRAQRSTAC